MARGSLLDRGWLCRFLDLRYNNPLRLMRASPRLPERGSHL
jgi:hypothetical protein